MTRPPLELWCRYNRGWLRPDGIIHIVAGAGMPSPDYAYTGADALAAQQVGLLLAAGKPYPVVGDMRSVQRARPDARRVQPPPLVSALAIIVESPVTRMLANAYLGITRPKQPTRVFTGLDAAVNWLHQHTLD